MVVKKFFHDRLADVISLFHISIVMIAAFGWWLLPDSPIHFAVLFGTWLSWIVLGSCVLASWEFSVRAKHDPSVRAYEDGYLHYHMRRLIPFAPSKQFIRVCGLFYPSLGMILWISNYFGLLA